MMHCCKSQRRTKFMKRNLFIALAIVGTLCLAGQVVTIAAHSGSNDKNAFTPETIPWGPPPPFVATGAQLSVIEGNPAASSGGYPGPWQRQEGYRVATQS